jgi:hypothetical protein
MSTGINQYENWMHTVWRPAMGWLYMATCAFDFIIFPIVWSATEALLKMPVTQWDPLTLRGAGFYHLAMGAILGVTAWTRGKEKLAIINGEMQIYQSSNSSSSTRPDRPSKPSARTILPEDPEADADLNIK